MSQILFRLVVALSGAIVLVLAFNVLVGGVATAGWFGERPFFTVTDDAQYRLIDSHVRFLGGLFAATGFVFLLGALNPMKYAQALYVVFAGIFLGGVARFAKPDMEAFLSSDVGSALAAELVLMPLLAFWLSRLRRD